MEFQADRRFDSLTEAFSYILDQYAQQPIERVWAQTTSGLTYPRELPRYLFRGECGDFQTTMDSARRLQADVISDGFQLRPIDVLKLGKLIFDLAVRLTERFDDLDRTGAVGLLQHYGLPTRLVDFTGNLGYAFAFAAAGTSSIGRVAVMPRAPSEALRVVDLMAHPWAERAQRQGAFGVLMTNSLPDLKSLEARSHLNIKWFEFPILPSDREFFRETHEQLIEPQNDPSAGFLRFHITEYVEAFGKLSPALTEWILERVAISPLCYKVEAFEEKEVVVYYRAADALPTFDKLTELEQTRRYWSSSYEDDSFERMKDFVWPAPGGITADPRTYHPEPRTK